MTFSDIIGISIKKVTTIFQFRKIGPMFVMEEIDTEIETRK